MQNIIYGAGQYGKIFYLAMQERGGTIDGFIDADPKKTSLFDKPVYKPSEIPENSNIYISVHMANTLIKNKLLMIKTAKVFDFVESLHLFPNILNHVARQNFLWMREKPNEMIDTEKLMSAKALFVDEASKQLLDKLIRFRQTYDMSFYPLPDGEMEYFPSTVPILDNLDSLRFLDCGAYTGDTIHDIVQLKKPIDYIASFEPDDTNFTKLQNEVTQYQDTFFTFKAAVWSENTILQFNNDSTSSSKIDDQGIKVPALSLDATFLAAKPNFIKMDIEGAEEEALKGSQHIIAKYSPNLAICLYHRPNDLWDLPLLINRINPNYSMYLRVHQHMGLSTVLYCIPKCGGTQ